MLPHSGTQALQPLSARRKLQYDPLPIRLIPPGPGPLPRSHSGKGAVSAGMSGGSRSVQVGAGNASRASPSPPESITPPKRWRALTSDATEATEATGMHRRLELIKTTVGWVRVVSLLAVGPSYQRRNWRHVECSKVFASFALFWRKSF